MRLEGLHLMLMAQLWSTIQCQTLLSSSSTSGHIQTIIDDSIGDDINLSENYIKPAVANETTTTENPPASRIVWVNIGLVLRPTDELYGLDLRERIGARVEEINRQFQATIARANQARNQHDIIQIKLVSTTLVRNPIEMSKIVCDQLIGHQAGGVVAVIVDTEHQYIDSIAAISFTLGLYNIPCIGTTLRDSSLFNKNLHSSYVSLIPPYSHQADVWYNLMLELGFRRAFVLTSPEDRDLLSRFVKLLEQQQQQPIDSELRIESIIEYDSTLLMMDGHRDGQAAPAAAAWADLIGKISSLLENSICRVFLVHGITENDVRIFLKVIDYFNMSSSEGFAIVLSEQTVQVALEHRLNLPNGILSSKLHSSNGTAIQSSFPSPIAYALDALEILARSISDLSSIQAQAAFRWLLMVPNSCKSASGSINDWPKGTELYWSVLGQTFSGLTGFIMFDENGDRLTANYKLLNLVNDSEQSNSNNNNRQFFQTIGSFANGVMPQPISDGTSSSSRSAQSQAISLNVSAIEWPGGLKGHLISGLFIDKHLRIVTLQEKPFVWVSESDECWSNGSRLINGSLALPCKREDPETGGERRFCCRGYCMDLLEEISKRLNFTYDLYLVQDNQYGRVGESGDESVASMMGQVRPTGGSSSGSYKASPGAANSPPFKLAERNANGEPLLLQQPPPDASGFSHNKVASWSGLMGELMSRRADMAFAPLTITPRRAQVIDFSKPFKFHGFSILLRRASKHTTLASFLQPFHNQLWILVIGVATHVVALTLYLLDRYSTFGHFGMKRKLIPTKPKTSHDDHPLHLSSSLWFSWSILLNSGVGEHTPKSLSGRVLGIFWSGFAMIVVASYTANLAAFLVLDSREETPTLSGIDDPRLRSGDLAFNFATVKGSAVDSYLQSQVEYINLYRKMEEFNFNNVDESIQALRGGTIDALIWDSTRLEWEVATDDKCSLGIAGELFGSSGYGIGLQKDSYWTKNVTTKLLELHESGFMMDLDRKWIAAGKSSQQQQQLQSGGGSAGGSGGACERRNEDYPETLGIVNIAGVFILFACGLVASFGLIVIERLCYKHRARLLRFKGDLWRRCKRAQ